MKSSIVKPISVSEHVFIGGMTGTGKSYLAEKYLSKYPRVWMLDTKGDTSRKLKDGLNPWPEVDPKKLTIIKSIVSLAEVRTPYLIYEPNMNELEEYFYNEFFKAAYFLENVTVWVDEAMNVSPSPYSLPDYYKGILTRGRSRNVSVWSLSQRPKGIASIIISQCTHFFVFNLQLPQDRKTITEITGVPEFLTKPGGHDFWYWRDGWDEAVKARLVS